MDELGRNLRDFNEQFIKVFNMKIYYNPVDFI